MSGKVLLHVEGDQDTIVAITSPDDRRVGTFSDDGPYLSFNGARVLGVYRQDGADLWRESLKDLNELYAAAKERECEHGQRAQ